MVEINVELWADWDEMISYTKEIQSLGLKVKLINVSELFEVWHGEELEQMGLKRIVLN